MAIRCTGCFLDKETNILKMRFSQITSNGTGGCKRKITPNIFLGEINLPMVRVKESDYNKLDYSLPRLFYKSENLLYYHEFSEDENEKLFYLASIRDYPHKCGESLEAGGCCSKLSPLSCPKVSDKDISSDDEEDEDYLENSSSRKIIRKKLHKYPFITKGLQFTGISSKSELNRIIVLRCAHYSDSADEEKTKIDFRHIAELKVGLAQFFVGDEITDSHTLKQYFKAKENEQKKLLAAAPFADKASEIEEEATQLLIDYKGVITDDITNIVCEIKKLSSKAIDEAIVKHSAWAAEKTVKKEGDLLLQLKEILG